MPTDHFEYRRFGFWRDQITHPLQGALLGMFTAMMRGLPLDAASAFGGFVGRTIGPRLRTSQRADQNLRRAMPHLNAAARQQILREMWDNLGRVMSEYPHLHQIIDRGRIEFVDLAGLPELLLKPQPVVFFGAHLANWELLAPFAVSLGIEMNVIYRSPNNRFADRLVRHLRSTPGLTQIRKSSAGAREAVRVIRKGGVLALLVDQKFNAGLPIPFFGHDAMTAPAAAQFGVHHSAMLLPARVERLAGARFRVTLYPPLNCPATSTPTSAHEVEATMGTINGIIEAWVRERPEQWLWVHRRWPKQ
jgi:Kdo2-lipid IVA lauroyltransferase/acyltransferase